jgi:enterochelin esterase-like enzyme
MWLSYKLRLLTSASIIMCCSASAQDYSLLQKTFRSLVESSKITDQLQQKEKINSIWTDLKSLNHIPVVAEDSVLFLYKGEGTSIQWMGDFNGWGYDKKFNNIGKQLPNTEVWYLKTSFPKNARLDYKILVNGTQWLIDPDNDYQQWSGVGGGSPNSELRMPDWKEDETLIVNENIPHGKLESDLLLKSKVLGYQITYSVYLPAHSEKSGKLPVIYVTDGYEYVHPKMGNMITVLDNLIAARKIKPVIAVFVDHREPINRSNNKRMEELAMNTKYIQFFTDELIPEIESIYPADTGSGNRAILGTSMGGLNAAYFVFSKPDVFSMAGIQSPAFYTRPQIYSLCNNASGTKIKISMTSGVFNDTSEGGQKMKGVLESNSCIYTYREVNEGHSWGNWRNLTDDILIDLFGFQ